MLIHVRNLKVNTREMSSDMWEELAKIVKENPDAVISISLYQWGLPHQILSKMGGEDGYLATIDCHPVLPGQLLEARLYYDDQWNRLKIVAYPDGLEHLLLNQAVVDRIEAELKERVLPRYPQVVSWLIEKIQKLGNQRDGLALAVENATQRLQQTKRFVKSPEIRSIREELDKAVKRAMEE